MGKIKRNKRVWLNGLVGNEMGRINLSDAFLELGKKYDANRVFDLLAKSETTQEYIFIVNPVKEKMIGGLRFNNFDEYRTSLLKFLGSNVPKDVLCGDFSRREIKVGECTLSYLVFRLLSEGRFTYKSLADKLEGECLSRYINNDVDPSFVYSEAYKFLEGLLNQSKVLIECNLD